MTDRSMRPLRAAFIGGALNSAVGYAHYTACRMDGAFQVVAGSFSRDPQQNAHTAAHYGVNPDRTYDDWRALLSAEQGAIDVVIVLTPTPSHVDVVIEALEAGHAVICEKALGVSSDDCRRIEACATKTGRYMAVTFNYSGYHMVRELRALIRAGKFGTLQQIQIEMPQEGFLRQRANPQAWRKQDHAVPTVSLDLGVHVHHLIDFLTDNRRLVRLTGEQSSYGPFQDVMDNVSCLAHYQDDLRVQAWWGKTALGQRNGLRVRVFGSQAAAEWYQMDPENLHWADNNGLRMTMDRGYAHTLLAHEPRYNRFKAGHPSGFIEAFANLYADLADDIRRHQSGHPKQNDFVFGATQARQGLEMMEAIARAAHEHKWLNMAHVRQTRQPQLRVASC